MLSRKKRSSFVGANSLLLFLLTFLLTVAAYSQQQPTPATAKTPVPGDQDVVKISTSLIQLDVTVVDAKGKVVTDLRPDEVEIYENGKKQKTTNFSFISSGRSVNQNNNSEKKDATDQVGVPLPVSEIRPEQVRRTIAIVVDDLSLSFESAAHTRRALRKIIDEQMQEGDLVAIMRTGSGIGSLQQFTSNKAMLNAAIERVRWNPVGNGGINAFRRLEPSFAELTTAAGGTLDQESAGNAEDVQKSFESFQTSTFAAGTLGALRFIVSGMAEMPGRKSVVLFSDGWKIFEQDEHGFTQSGTVANFLKRLVDLANRSSVVFYPIDARGLQFTGPTAADKMPMDPRAYSAIWSTRSSELYDSQAGMSYLAEETGGLVHKNSNDLSGGVRKALQDQSYYLLGYEPDSETFDAKKLKYNKLEIKITRPGLTARHRSGFFNVAETEIAKPAVNTESPNMQLLSAMKSPFIVNDISMRLNALFGSDKGSAYVQSLLHVEAKDLKFSDDSDGSKTAVFDVWATGFGDNGTPVDQIQKTYTLNVKADKIEKVLNDGFVYNFVFPVKKAGGYQYRVALRDKNSGKIGTASQFIQIPNLKKGRLAASSMLIESFTTEEWAKLFDPNAGSARSAFQTDTAVRRIKLGSVLRYGFDVYNAKLDGSRKPSLQSRIRVFRDGELVLDGQSIPVDLNGQIDMKRVQLSGAVSLSKEMLPGDYILQVIVTDALAKKKEQVTAQHVQFEVMQ